MSRNAKRRHDEERLLKKRLARRANEYCRGSEREEGMLKRRGRLVLKCGHRWRCWECRKQKGAINGPKIEDYDDN